jgi:hypothetical protein
MRIRIQIYHFYEDPEEDLDPAYHLDADADPDPQHCLQLLTCYENGGN